MDSHSNAASVFLPGKPEASEYAPYYANYIKHVSEDDIVKALAEQLEDTRMLLRGVSEQEAETRHAPYTWSIKEVLGHVSDSERIFGIRALRFARCDTSPLPGFDENSYVKSANFDSRTLSSLLEEFVHVRTAHVSMFQFLERAAWTRMGVANGEPVSVRALAYIIVGHARHHVAILRKRLQ